MKLWPNKISASCVSCGDRLAPREGWSWRDGRGWRSVCRSAACARDAGVANDEPAPAALSARLDGSTIVVRTPPPWEMSSDPRPLLRGLPGARFDRAITAWRCSARDEDRGRVLEVLDRLGCEYDDALRVVARNPLVDEALARADAIPTLRAYQRAGIEWLARRTNALLGDDMGLGKTLQTLVALPAGGRAVVVCPASLKFVWRDEAARWRPDLRVTVLSGRGSFRAPEPGEILVLNFAILPTETEIQDADLADVTLVVDEAVAVKSFQRSRGGVKGSARAKRIYALGQRCGRRQLLTGTPLANRPPDLWGLLDAGGMAEEAFDSFGRFYRAFNAQRGRYGTDWGEPDASVPERLRRVMLRRTKAAVLQDLPKKQYQWMAVNGENRTLMRSLDKLWAEWGDAIEAGVLPPFEVFSAARAALAASRVQHTIEVAESYEDAGRPLVVFSAHRAPIDALGQRDGWAAITGDTSADDRAAAVRAFQAGQLRGLALTIAAGGTGLTLTAADTVLFVDLAWRPSDNAQAEDRICRIGQTAESCHVIRMISDHVLDQRVAQLLAQKQALIDAAVEHEHQFDATPAAPATPKFAEESDADHATRIAARDAAIAAAAEKAQRAEHRETVERVFLRETERAGISDVPMTPQRRDAVRDAYQLMLARCDGARKRDNAGFNKPDAVVAHNIAAFDLDDDRSLQALCLMLRRYPRQTREFAAIF